MDMAADNLTELIEILVEYEDIDQDPRLEEGQIFGSNGQIIYL